jgi:uncharacterized membrane protein
VLLADGTVIFSVKQTVNALFVLKLIGLGMTIIKLIMIIIIIIIIIIIMRLISIQWVSINVQA